MCNDLSEKVRSFEHANCVKVIIRALEVNAFGLHQYKALGT